MTAAACVMPDRKEHFAHNGSLFRRRFFRGGRGFFFQPPPLCLSRSSKNNNNNSKTAADCGQERENKHGGRGSGTGAAAKQHVEHVSVPGVSRFWVADSLRPARGTLTHTHTTLRFTQQRGRRLREGVAANERQLQKQLFKNRKCDRSRTICGVIWIL